MDISEHIQYWVKGSEEDIAAAESLVEKDYFRHGLFFAHLAIEKMLKAHVEKVTQKTPPKIHNLIRLAEIAGLKMAAQDEDFVRKFGVYQLEGRYADTGQIPLDLPMVRQRISGAKEILKWLKQQL